MQKFHKLTLALMAAAVLISVPSAHAAYLSNLPAANNGNFVNIGGGLSYAVGFTNLSTVGLVDAQLILTVPAGSSDVLSLYSDVSGKPGADLLTFTSSTTVGTAQTDTFTGTYTLLPSTSYFLVLTGGAAFSQWDATFTGANPNGVTPTGTGATYLTQFSGSGPVGGAPTSYSASSIIPNFELDISPAASAPEPSSFGLAGLGIAAALLAIRARKQRTA